MIVDPWHGTHDDRPDWDGGLLWSLAGALLGAAMVAAPLWAYLRRWL